MSAEEIKPVTEEAKGQTVEQQVITQIEFYLSDSNLPFDKFLFSNWANSFHSPAQVISATPIPDEHQSLTAPEGSIHPFHLGWFPLAKLTSFKRMQPHLAPPPAGLGSTDAVAAALEKSALVEARKFGAEGEEGAGWYVRRKSELKRPEDAMDRSAYAKGFPTFELPEAPTAEQRTEVKQKEDALQIELEAWARALNVGDVKAVRMRRDTKGPVINGKATVAKGRGKFKGSVFIEFANKDSVAAFLALEPKPTFNDAALETMSKSAYVEMKRLIYAPDSEPIAGAAAVPRNPHAKNPRPFNAWAEKLVGPRGFPRKVDLPEPRTNGKDANSKKRKAEDGDDEEQTREVLFDGVRFTAKKLPSGEVEIVDEASVGTEAGKWTNKVLKFTIKSKAADGAAEAGAPVNFGDLKKLCFPIVKPGFFSLLDKPAPEAEAVEAHKSEFPTKLTAPPTIGSAAEAAPAAAPAIDARQQAYPARGQAAFRDEVTDEILEKIKSDIGSFEGRQVEWVRVSPEEERAYTLGRARFHASQAFEPQGSFGGGRGGRGGRGGGRGGRGGRGGNRGGPRDKRPRRD